MPKKFGRQGFSLIEVLIYTAIFAISATFLVAILTTVTRVQTRQVSSNEVNSQLAFVNATLQAIIQQSALVDMTPGVASTTLNLRMTSSTLDSTTVYASGTILYLTQGSSTVPLTDSNVAVNSFTATKFENPGGFSVVQINLGMSSHTSSTQAQVTRFLESAIARISAATFDSSVTPNADNGLDLGTASTRWRNGYFSSFVDVYGNVGIGTQHSASAALKSTGDVGFSTSSAGIILMAPSGSCYRLTINSSLQLTTSSATCP
ncbi:MAG: hypothetical protein UY51_C0005G0067 [Candidatus Jorgensenbacteria bacterium GW2011_GWB1_49_9]|nr:MAG: hypothetical protein UY51_C0005G0067 [Candidatus Jorgensenbacteria bacterium GW2011_GWB1_49_9]